MKYLNKSVDLINSVENTSGLVAAMPCRLLPEFITIFKTSGVGFDAELSVTQW